MQVPLTAPNSLQRTGSMVKDGIRRMGSKLRGRRGSEPGNVRRGDLGDVEEVNDYRIEKMIGHGSHSTVFLAVHEPSGKQYAIKAVTYHLKKKTRSLWARGPEQFLSASAAYEDPDKMLDREIAIMKKLKHENIVSLLEVIEDRISREVYLVLDYLPRGPVMHDVMRCEPMSEDTAWDLFRQLLLAVDFCHAHGVVHCDIKPSNLLWGEGNTIKLSDFGTSRVIQEKEGEIDDQITLRGAEGLQNDMVSQVMGTTTFLSPQAHSGEPFSGRANDVWCTGVTLFFFVYGYCPFSGENVMDLNEKIQQNEIEFPETPATSPELQDLIRHMLQKSERDRYTLQQAMQHEWVTKKGTAVLPSAVRAPSKVAPGLGAMVKAMREASFKEKS